MTRKTLIILCFITIIFIAVIAALTIINLNRNNALEQTSPTATNEELVEQFIKCLEESPEHWSSYRNYMYLVTNRLLETPSQLYHALMFDLENNPDFKDLLKHDIQKACDGRYI